MVWLDSTAYRCLPYLSDHGGKIDSKIDYLRADSPAGVDELQAEEDRIHRVGVYFEWREKMAEWSYQVVDHFGYDREVVDLSISFLDRYMSTCPPKAVVSMKAFQLLAVGALFLACKLQFTVNGDCHPQRPLSAAALAKLCRGYFIPEQVESTELSILSRLQWRVHPPTSLAFVKHLLLLLPWDACTPQERVHLEETSKFLLELSVMDGAFVHYKRSTIALAAIMCSFNLPDKTRQIFFDAVHDATGLDLDDDVIRCADRLNNISTACGK